MESYRRVAQDIERERTNFLEKIDLVQPSFEEEHQLQWNSRYQEEEISALRSELDRVARGVEAETKELQEREDTIREIREEQRQDRIKIQTLLALSQPITPDIAVVFGSLAPSFHSSSPSARQEPTVEAARPRARDSSRRQAGGVDSKGDDGGAYSYSSGDAADLAGNGGNNRRARVPLGDVNGISFAKRGLEVPTLGEEKGGMAGGLQGQRPGWRMEGERCGRPRSSVKLGKGGNIVRCTRGYKDYLERRLELNQVHLMELDRLHHYYEETLETDLHKRKMQAQVQRQNVALLASSLRRRAVEVDGRLARAMEDYLRLRRKAKEAHAVSAEEQQEYAKAQQKREAQLKRHLAAAEAEITEIEREGKTKLEDSTLELRERVLKADGALQDERSYQAEIKQRYEDRVARAHEAVLSLRRRHRKLVDRRAKEVVHLSEEMSALRRGVTELERRMFAAW
ncbi:unnamed protein product [Ascophyllum nodosum]